MSYEKIVAILEALKESQDIPYAYYFWRMTRSIGMSHSLPSNYIHVRRTWKQSRRSLHSSTLTR